MNNLDGFIQWMKVHRKSSPRTREMYEYNLGRFFKLYDEMNQENLDQYFADMHDKVESKKISKSHANTSISAVNVYNEYLEYKGAKSFRTPTRYKVKTLPKYVDFCEFEDIIDEFGYIFRDTLSKKVLALFMLYVPLRKSDVATLKREQFDLDNGYLNFEIEKTENEIKIPICSELIPVLDLYFSKEPEKTNAFNTSIPQINYMFRKIKEYTDMDVSPHMMRGTFAVWYLQIRDSAYALKELQEIFGHQNIETTARYARLLPKDLKKSINDVFAQHKKNRKKNK